MIEGRAGTVGRVRGSGGGRSLIFTPGFIMVAKCLLDRSPTAGRDEMWRLVSGGQS